MADSTFSVRLPADLHDKLDSLSKATRRSKNYLAREAITNYVLRESSIVDAVNEGIADLDAGRTVSHEDVMRRMESIIASPRKIAV